MQNTDHHDTDRGRDAFRSHFDGRRCQLPFAEFRTANKGFAYKDGDKVSQYGLAALVTGEAAAAAKTGLFAGLIKGALAFWKVIAIGIIAFFAAIRRFVGKLFGGGKELGPPPGE